MKKTFLILILACLSSDILKAVEKKNLNDSFQIMFWDKTSDNDIEIISKLSVQELLEKYKPYLAISPKQIFEYYWDEQVLLIYSKEIFQSGLVFRSGGVFTVFFDKKIVYHGLNRTFLPPFYTEYDKSSFPMITMYGLNKDYVAFYLIPVISKWNFRFKDFSEIEKKKILNDNVYSFFKEKNKIVHGECDELFER